MSTDARRSKWEELIKRYSKNALYKSRTCAIYNNKSEPRPPPADQGCPCGRLIRRHSFSEKCLQPMGDQNGSSEWEAPREFLDGDKHSANVDLSVYGTLNSNGCKFLRIDTRIASDDLFNLLVEDGGDQKPALIISVYGGAKYFAMAERLEKEFIRGVIDAAAMAGKEYLPRVVLNSRSF
jgi:SLOG in TRPM